MDFVTQAGEQQYAALVRASAEAVIGLDFDGTLSPIVDDPDQAYIHSDAKDVLVELATQVRAVAVITGRPARQALALGGLEGVGDAIDAAGKELYLFGQYGDQRWTSADRRIVSPRPPAGLATFESELPAVLRRLNVEAAFVEDKGLAVAVHTRRLPDAQAAFDRLLPELERLAEANDLTVEPGKSVIEVRSAGMHKGLVVERLNEELAPGGFCFVGDDLGDLEAFEAVRVLGRGGLPTLLVCSASAEDQDQSQLAPLADVVVDGPDGVLELLSQLAADSRELRA